MMFCFSYSVSYSHTRCNTNCKTFFSINFYKKADGGEGASIDKTVKGGYKETCSGSEVIRADSSVG